MNEKTVNTITAILAALGAILILMMAFDVMPGQGNILLFAGLVCFIISGLVKKLVGKK